MSQKKSKILRREAKKILEKRMQNGQPQKPQYSFAQLENFIQLYTFLTGIKPQQIELTPQIYDMHVQESQRHSDTLGLNLGFRNNEPTFLGVRLIKKTPIEVAKVMPDAPPPAVNKN